MKKKIVCAVMMLMVLMLSCTDFVLAQGDHSTGKQIADIKVKGNNSVSAATILSRLKVKRGDVFEEHAVNKELKRLYATGYFSDVFVETEDLPEGERGRRL